MDFVRLTVEETPAMRMGSMSVVVVFSSFLLFFSGGPGGLSPPEGRFPPPAPDIFPSPIKPYKFTVNAVEINLRAIN